MWQYVQNTINSRINETMVTLYQKLKKKLDALTKPTRTSNNTRKSTQAEHERLINLTTVTFTKEHINTLTLGLNYAIEKDPKHYINELIIDTENAIRQLQPNIQSVFRYLATKKSDKS